MKFLKNLFGSKNTDGVGIEKRKAERKHLKEFFKIQLSINGIKFRISDFSSSGIGLIDEGNLQMEVGKTYSADMVAYGQKKCTVRLKVVRRSAKVFGCEILDQDTFKTFEEDYLAQEAKK